MKPSASSAARLEDNFEVITGLQTLSEFQPRVAKASVRDESAVCRRRSRLRLSFPPA